MSNGYPCVRLLKLETLLGSKHKFKTRYCGLQEAEHEEARDECTPDEEEKLRACNKHGGYLRSKKELEYLLENPQDAPPGVDVDSEEFRAECEENKIKLPPEKFLEMD